MCATNRKQSKMYLKFESFILVLMIFVKDLSTGWRELIFDATIPFNHGKLLFNYFR